MGFSPYLNKYICNWLECGYGRKSPGLYERYADSLLPEARRSPEESPATAFHHPPNQKSPPELAFLFDLSSLVGPSTTLEEFSC